MLQFHSRHRAVPVDAPRKSAEVGLSHYVVEHRVEIAASSGNGIDQTLSDTDGSRAPHCFHLIVSARVRHWKTFRHHVLCAGRRRKDAAAKDRVPDSYGFKKIFVLHLASGRRPFSFRVFSCGYNNTWQLA